MVMVTADLVDPSDISMTDSVTGRSPRFAAGVIGEPSPGLFASYPISHPKTPGSQNQAEDDLAALLARAHRQHQVEKTRVSHNGDLNGMNGELPTHTRWGDSIWDRKSHKSNGNGNSNGHGIGLKHGSMPSPKRDGAPHSAPLPPFEPFGDMQMQHHQAAPNPLMPIGPSPPQPGVPLIRDPAGQVAHHLMSLSTLFNPLLLQSDEVDRLRREVDMWKGEWARVDRERKGLEDVVASAPSPKVCLT